MGAKSEVFVTAADNDWRLQGQERYLRGATLTFRQYRRWSTSWDHDHCAFCTARFRQDSGPEILTEGYCTTDEYHWICPACFEDFNERFGWKTVPSPSFRVLPGLPSYGATAIPFPPSFARSGREGLVVEFHPDTPGAWVGNFAAGLGGYTGAHVHPNGRDIVVFNGGAGCVVDPETREWADLPGSGFIADGRRVRNPPGFVCDVQGTSFFRIGPDGVVWHTRRLSLDGFRDVVFTEDRITGSGIEMDGKTWTPFEVDLRTGDARGGPQVPLP